MPGEGEDEGLTKLARWVGIGLALAGLAPLETTADGAVSLSRMVADLSPAARIAALAPAIAGAALAIASFALRDKSPRRLGGVAIVALAAPVLATWMGAESLARDGVRLADANAHPAAFAILAVACSIAAAREEAAIRARRLLWLGALFASIFLLWPWHGAAPAMAVPRGLRHALAYGKAPIAFGGGLLSGIVLWPAAAVVLAALARPRSRGAAPTWVVAVLVVPLALLPFVPETLSGLVEAQGLVPGLAAVAALMLRLTLWTAIVRRISADWIWRPSVALAIVALLQWISARAPSPGPPIRLASSGAEHVFGSLLVRWNDERAAVDVPALRDAPAGSRGADVAASELVRAARAVDASLGSSIQELTRGAGDPSTTDLRWRRLVAAVNGAARAASEPYRLDPTGTMFAGGSRWFRVDGYRISEVHRFACGGAGVRDVLLGRSTAPDRSRPSELGSSRDDDPNALVEMDAMNAYGGDLEELAAQTPPICADVAAESQQAAEGLRACGAMLHDLARSGLLRPALLESTERHELEHVIDGPLLPWATSVSERLVFLERPARARANRELAAYVAQMTAPGAAARLTLVRLVRMALVSRGVEGTVAWLAMSALAREGALSSQTSLLRAFEDLAALGDDAVRERAREAFRALYGLEIARCSLSAVSSME